MNSKLSHVMATVFDKPWFVREQTLATIADVVRLHVAGGSLTPEEIEARVAAVNAAAGPRGGTRTMGAVGVIPVYGAIFPRANLMTAFSGGATVEGIRESLRSALADDAIGSILLDVDSPGGYTDGIEELATEIRESRGRKPIVAISNYTMASAAYYLASQADEVVASPSAEVGWIGCVVVHQEYSKLDEAEGVTTTIIRNPVGKYGGNQYEPLSEQTRAEITAVVDERSSQFVNAVAKGRGVSAATVRSDFGQGGGMTASRAKAAGLVDRVETFDQVVQRLASGKGPLPRGTGATTGLVWTPTSTSSWSVELEESQGGDLSPADDPDAAAPGEAGTPPDDRSLEAEAALALARAKVGGTAR